MGDLLKIDKHSCRWRRRKEDRPGEILSAALNSFSIKGFSATKLDDVAKQAGVSKGTLYLYFENKEALLIAVVNEFVLPQIAKAEKEAKQNDGPIKDLMAKLLEQWRINVLETELSGIPKIIVAEASNFPELASFYLENVIKRSRTMISDLIRLGISRGEFSQCDTEFAARTFLTHIIFSAIWKHSLGPFDEPYDVKEYLNSILNIFLNGILKERQ